MTSGAGKTRDETGMKCPLCGGELDALERVKREIESWDGDDSWSYYRGRIRNIVDPIFGGSDA